MGLTTSLYTLDIDQLKKKMGSNDPKLIEKLAGKKKKSSQGRDLRVLIDLNGNITIDGIPRTSEFLAAEIVRPKWARRELIMTFQPGKKPNRYSQPQADINALLSELYPKTKFSCLCSDWDWEGEEADEITTEQAAIELVMGRCSQPDNPDEYGYGFKSICDLVGKHLGVISGELEVAISWPTRLLHPRTPVKMPMPECFPFISYLTAKEVEAELKKFSALDPTAAAEKWKLSNRKQFLSYLGQASKSKKAIVAFCH